MLITMSQPLQELIFLSSSYDDEKHHRVCLRQKQKQWQYDDDGRIQIINITYLN